MYLPHAFILTSMDLINSTAIFFIIESHANDYDYEYLFLMFIDNFLLFFYYYLIRINLDKAIM